MKINKIGSLVLASLMLLTTVGCSKETSDSQTISKTVKGYGGDIVVEVTLDGDTLTSVKATGEKETPTLGGVVLQQLPEKMVEANSYDVDIVAGATVTSNALKDAVKQAINEAKGVTETISEAKMKPGTYTASAAGFSLLQPLEVEVKVNETNIESITVKENGETYPFVTAAAERLIPRMIENNSVKIDSISGCTGSSNGIKLATEQALKQALKEGGSEESAIENFYSVPAKSTDKETIDVDVLVVGLGGSGAAAAMSAAETQYALNGNDASKVSVLGIDKAGKYGGTSCITADTMGINAPIYQETYHGGKDYVDEQVMKDDWNNFTMGDAKQDILDLFFDESGNTIDWLISHGFDYGKGSPDGEGFEYGGPQRGFTDQDVYYVKFQYTGQGYGNWKKETGEMFDALMQDYTDMGGKYMLEVEAQEFIYDKDSNTVKGVKAIGYDGTEYTINAKQVIMGTGGFSNNAKLQEEYLSNEYYPLKGSWLMYGMQQNDGKLFEDALNIGAGTYNIGMPPMVHLAGAPITLHDYEVEIVGDENDVGFWSALPRRNSLNDIPQALANAGYAMWVDMNGARFANEAGTFQCWKSGPKYYTIWSDDFFQTLLTTGLPVGFADDLTCQGGWDAGRPIENIYELIDLCVEKGIAYKADTLEDLAKQTGMDLATLQASIDNYNLAVENQEDVEFGKNPNNLIVSINHEGPYYAFVGASYIYSTVGGLDLNTDIQVLSSDNQTPINGLYAVGTDSLGVLFSEQKEYVTYGGAAQGWAYTSGRLAGRNAVNALSE